MNIAPYIDHTVLRPTTTPADVRRVCEEASRFGFAAVCIPPPFVRSAASLLERSPVKVATVAGFPFGYSVAQAKLAEVERALADGAQEIDVVINLAALKSGAWDYLATEIDVLIATIHEQGAIVKVIIESGVLTRDEILRCCELYAKAKVDFVKTSTGYAEHGASVDTVQLMRSNLPSDVRIKASGGIKTYAFASELVEAGAARIGASASVAIVEQSHE